MPWVKVDERARSHPKFFRAGCLAWGWWNAGLGYCNERLTNGFIPVSDLELVFAGMFPADREAAIESLVREGSLHVVSPGRRVECRTSGWCRRFQTREGGYLMHDYLDYQPSRKQVELLKKVRLHAARKGGEKSAKVRNQVGSTKPEATRPTPYRTVPTRTEEAQKLTALSGSPPDGAARNGHKHHDEARSVLAFLNEKAGRSYRPVEENLRLISARLKSGATVEDCRGVIARKVREWNKEPDPGQKDMRKFLRPATLFAATNFEQYIGEQGHGG